ncbi:MAG: ABC transporter [Desulfitibacter sp. BRH_c19]|nr:MAG: ABC transporter [Desulfitibacter sp. BRH_c19]
MNVFIREMKANRKSLIIWSIGVFLMVASSMGKYAALSASGQSINDLLGQMPNSLKAIMGLGTFDLSTVIGYYGVLFIYLVVMATIHAAMLGANIISKEERDKTAEFLLVKPISRNKIITSKLSATLVNILVLNLVTFVSSIVMVQKYSNGESVIGDITVLMIGMFMLQLIFLFIGTAIAAISKNPKTATSLSTGILLITFILSVAIDINSRIENLKYLTPFKYYEAKNLLLDGGFDAVYVILSAVIIPVLFSTTYVFYRKRDLNV